MADELDALRKASSGLLYPSDTDTPFDVFTWATAAAAAPADALKAQGKESGQIQQVTVDQFFAELADANDAAKFKKLKQAVDSTLTDATVLRIGDKSIDVYIVGKTKSGAFGGLHTRSIET